jgi:hypothetical protein
MAPRKRPYSDGNMQPIDGDRLSQRQVSIIEVDALKVIDDYAIAGTEYIGWAQCGAVAGDPIWKIMRKTTVASVDTIEWADGNTKFDNIWTNRAALTYK